MTQPSDIPAGEDGRLGAVPADFVRHANLNVDEEEQRPVPRRQPYRPAETVTEDDAQRLLAAARSVC